MTTFAFDHVGLSVADLDAQHRFYSQALGFAGEARTEMPRARIRTAVLSAPGGLRIELIERRGSAPQSFTDAYDGAGTQGYFRRALAVDDLDQAFDGVLAAGATRRHLTQDESRPAESEWACSLSGHDGLIQGWLMTTFTLRFRSVLRENDGE